ncbi:MAG: PTS sugar transporter subunit IIB [Clostridia bacterium]
MKKILLICSAGMSTSMLVTKMKVAAETIDTETEIWAVGYADQASNIQKADIILLGPQVRYLKDSIEDALDEPKPVHVIDMAAYGAMDGKKVLDFALEKLQ